jgi:hypothetical protein
MTANVTDYSKRAFEDATRAFEQLAGSKSVEQAIQIQSKYAKKVYDTWVAEASKPSDMYVGMARDAYKPVEQAVAKPSPNIAKERPGGSGPSGSFFVGALLFAG